MSTAKKIGERCRKFRNALGVSQQALADQVGTTPQNISKYEKEGVYNIETIQALSQALGHDLLSDEMENEGDVGEIGRELLCAMIGYKFPFHSTEYGLGYIYTKDLFEQNVMYGLDENRIVREIFKLEKLGLCVREQYTDFYGEQIDRVFITAKGAITIKHIINSDEILSYLDDIVTYEIICGKYSSYQEYIDNNVLEKKIRNLPMNSSFRANYIHFLHRNFEKGLDCYRLDMNMSPCFFSGRNCYYDIMYHMIIDFDLTQSDAIEEGVVSKKEAINHISFLIKLNEKTNKLDALQKWKSDRDYLQGYVKGSKQLVGVNRILKEKDVIEP